MYAVINWIFWLILQLMNLGPYYIPMIFYYILVILILWLIQIFWPLVVTFIVEFFTPLFNVWLLMWEFILNLNLIIWKICFQIWNIFVPFIGMILYVVIDLVVTIFQLVMDILGAIDIMPIIQAILEVLFFIIDIIMQILMVFIEVGMGVLQAVTEVIGFILEMFMVVVKVWLDILIWVIDLLFKILEPILLIIQALASAFTWMMASKKYASRKLLSLGLSTLLLNNPLNSNNFDGNGGETSIDEIDKLPTYEEYVKDVYDNYRGFVKSGNSTVSRILKDQYHIELDNPHASEERIEENILKRQSVGNKFSSSRGGKRDILQYQGKETFDRKPGVQFESDNNDEIDQTTTTFMHHFHGGVKKLVRDGTDFNLMHRTMERISNFWKSNDRLSEKSILARFEQQHPSLSRANQGAGPASIRYQNTPEHPRDMHVRFHEHRRSYAKRNGLHESFAVNTIKHLNKIKRPGGGGRTLLSSNKGEKGAHQWDDSKRVHIESLAKMERDHAREIVHQEKKYYGHHIQRIKTARVIHKAARATILKHAKTTFHADNIFGHISTILDQFGYKDPWEVYHDFLKTHGDAETFILSLSVFTEHPLLKYLKEQDPERDTKPFFHDWKEQQKELEKLRKNRRAGSGTSRKLLQEEDVDDSKKGNKGGSQEKFSGLEIIAKTDCYSSPRNPLCLPEIPPDFIFSFGQLTWPDDITEDSEICPPWIRTKCFICWARYNNAWQGIRFLISAMPFFNFPLTVFATLVPFLAWTVSWVFLVPMGCLASGKQILCFFMHIYDYVIVAISFWAISFFVWPIVESLIVIPWNQCVHSYSENRQLESDWEESAHDDPRLSKLFKSWNSRADSYSYADSGGMISSVLTKMGKSVNQQQHNVFNIYHTSRKQQQYTNNNSIEPSIFGRIKKKETHDERFIRLAKEYAGSLATASIQKRKLQSLLAAIGIGLDHSISSSSNDTLTTAKYIIDNHDMFKITDQTGNDESLSGTSKHGPIDI